MMPRDELFEEFLLEGRELTARAAEELSRLAGDGANRAALDGLFRAVHTLKGSAALFDAPELTALFHRVETRLEAARRGGVLDAAGRATQERALDLADAWFDALDRDGAPSDRLRRETVAFDVAPATADGGRGAADGRPQRLAAGRGDARVSIRYAPSADAYFRGDDPLAVVRGIPGLVGLEIQAPRAGGDYDPFQCSVTLHALSAAPIEDVRTATRLVADQVELAELDAPASPAEPSPAAGLALRSLRVEAQRLDEVAALVDELVIAKNGLLHQVNVLAAAAGEAGRSRELANSHAGLERLVADLHASVTGLRLVTLSHVFGRLPRQVREISEALGKDVELVVSGDRVAVDKSVVEGLFEPLLHLVRNAIDHGVEAPAVRRESGKRERARLTISAQARGDEVTIDVGDDGAGIDVLHVRRLAVERGLVDADSAERLSDAEAAGLVFAAGFSTAGSVSELSGRGVGMDAVRAAVTQMGGRVTLTNRPGQGLSVRLSLPAHVVLTKILVVKVGDARFGVPLESVVETHRVRPDEVTAIRAGRAYVRRDSVVPLLRLGDLLGLAGRGEAGPFPVLRVSAAGEPVGIQIDAIAERIEAPLRPMGGLLAGYPGVLGTVLQGDGEVLLVLDLAELAA